MATRKTTRKKPATRKAKKSTAKKAGTTAQKPPTPGQKAWQVTWQLMGELKRMQRAYLRVGAMLVEVRDRKYYADLNHPDIESYAAQRLHLAKTSLYKYLNVYDSTLHRVRERIAALDPAIPDAVEQLDALVGILGNARALKLAGLDTVLNAETPTSRLAFYA
jgi:hypothetical protein